MELLGSFVLSGISRAKLENLKVPGKKLKNLLKPPFLPPCLVLFWNSLMNTLKKKLNRANGILSAGQTMLQSWMLQSRTRLATPFYATCHNFFFVACYMLHYQTCLYLTDVACYKLHSICVLIAFECVWTFEIPWKGCVYN